jgi:hypothetical protein
MIRAAAYKEDHHMHIASIGVDLGETTFHLGALGEQGTGGFGQWVHQLEARAPRNKVVVAIANKLARIAWAVLFRAEDYRHMAVCTQA